MKKTPFKILLLSALTIWFAGCSTDDDAEKGTPAPIVLTKSELKLTRSAGELQTFLGSSGLDLPIDKLQYEVDMYRVEYSTIYKGTTITASGLVFVPDTDETVSVMSFQHGTIAAERQAPSSLPLNSSELVFYAGMSSLGFVMIVPDFVGFGASTDLMHPYYIEEVTASAVLDNIYAGVNLAEELGITIDNELYLAGYSQGGYATMATHKAIEEKGIDQLKLVASFPASGGYDLLGVRRFFFEQETYDEPFFLGYVAKSFKTYYDWSQSLGLLFNAPYAAAIDTLYDGTYSGNEINAVLTTNVADLVNADYLADPTAAEFGYATEAFEENSLTDWIPATPMHMYHGDADITVPYQNSVEVYNYFMAEGASSEIVTFTSLPGGTHGTGVAPYIEDFISKLVTYESN